MQAPHVIGHASFVGAAMPLLHHNIGTLGRVWQSVILDRREKRMAAVDCKQKQSFDRIRRCIIKPIRFRKVFFCPDPCLHLWDISLLLQSLFFVFAYDDFQLVF